MSQMAFHTQVITQDPGFCPNCKQKYGRRIWTISTVMEFLGFFLIIVCVIVLFVLPNRVEDLKKYRTVAIVVFVLAILMCVTGCVLSCIGVVTLFPRWQFYPNPTHNFEF